MKLWKRIIEYKNKFKLSLNKKMSMNNRCGNTWKNCNKKMSSLKSKIKRFIHKNNR